MYTLKVDEFSPPYKSSLIPPLSDRCNYSTSYAPFSHSQARDTLTNSLAVVSIVGIACESYNVLCAISGFNLHFANVYLEVIDPVSIR